MGGKITLLFYHKAIAAVLKTPLIMFYVAGYLKKPLSHPDFLL